MNDLLMPIKNVQIVDRGKLRANDYNPNKVLRENLDLLTKSILQNGWTMPIVVRPDYTIIDGFHRWTVSGEEPLLSKLKGKVPVVIVEHTDATGDMYGTITHNRARGTHLLEPMEKIVQKLLKDGVPTKEICAQLGMRPEEVFRLSGISKDGFLELMAQSKTYSKAKLIKHINA